jgi:integrase
VNVAAMAHTPTAKTRPDPPSADEAARLLNDAWQDPEWGMQLWLTTARRAGHRRPPG